MVSVFYEISLEKLYEQPIMFDANIFMVGIDRRANDLNASFDNVKETIMIPVFESFKRILIHEKVYRELDTEAQEFINSFLEKNAEIVSEADLYGRDPRYTDIFNSIADHERVRYQRGESKNQGEVYSLAYAAYHNINFFSSKEIMVDVIANEIEALKDISIITFDIIMVISYLFYMKRHDTSKNKALKAMYKREGEDVVRRHHLPKTLGEYIKALGDNTLLLQ